MSEHINTISFGDCGSAYTTDSITTGQMSVWPYWQWQPWYDSTGQFIYTNSHYCMGDTHVFACEHATHCRCGKAHREVESKKCGVCGK